MIWLCFEYRYSGAKRAAAEAVFGAMKNKAWS